FFFSSRRRHTRSKRDWSSDVCSSDLVVAATARIVARIINSCFRSDHSQFQSHKPHQRLESRPRGLLAGNGPVVQRIVRIGVDLRSEEHTSELQSRFDLVCRLLLEKKK